jgi:hypothetical protein
MNYTYNINEEIARWATEVYIKNHPESNWWIAFTNPTAGPWKKIVVPLKKGNTVEVYRFAREEERPDLILINDTIKMILLVEAKDSCEKLIAKVQMTKSCRVISAISKALRECPSEHWGARKEYRIKASFLWWCNEKNLALNEVEKVEESFNQCAPTDIDHKPLHIIIFKDNADNLVNNFIHHGKMYTDLNIRYII